MEPVPDRLELFRMAMTDHNIIEAGMQSFRRMLSGTPPKHAPKEFDDLALLFRNMLPKHFAFEEEKIFPLLLADNPSEEVSRLILELKEEHKQLLVEIKGLPLELSSHSQRQSVGMTWMEFVGFFDRQQKHASKEDELFRLVTK
jgi:hypothetical protein